MAVWECAECTAKYSVGAPKCPQCGSTVRINEATQPEQTEQQKETSMPKVTVHGGPTIDGFEVDPDSGELTPIEEGGEESSPGSSSSTSSEKESASPATSSSKSPSPAPKTGSRSAKDRT
ncbi:hypothetical protein [Streptomyces silaceus]|uniref:hypothetical protein n=1 Tax=Streptomyces silaceus TaxID=545123 RepID=UPI0006EBABB8|nr:hypothetical protein [Streptomyces silaceus]